MTDLNPLFAMTNDYRAMCAELLAALEIQLDELRFNNRLCIRARALLAQSEPQPPADDEVAVAVALIELRSTVMGLGQMGMFVVAQRVGRAADLLERLASDNAGLEAAADSLWADNVSLLDN